MVLPVHNQADHIRTVVAEYVWPPSTRMPDATRDRPGARTRAATTRRRSAPPLGREHDRVRVGPERASAAGDGRCGAGSREARGDLLCYTNSARTDGRGPDAAACSTRVAYPGVVVKANRKIREHWRRRLGSLLYNLECRALFDLSDWDVNGTPKVFPAQLRASCSRSRATTT